MTLESRESTANPGSPSAPPPAGSGAARPSRTPGAAVVRSSRATRSAGSSGARSAEYERTSAPERAHRARSTGASRATTVAAGPGADGVRAGVATQGGAPTGGRTPGAVRTSAESGSSRARTAAEVGSDVPGDWRMVRRLWPFLLAATVSLIPFTVFGMYLVPIAAAAEGTVAEIGGLRGLGGLAALVVGFALAPLIDRLPRELAAAAGLALLGFAALLGAVGNVFALAAFCLLIGASTSVLTPAIGAAAADRFSSPAAAGRAATLVSATTSMMAMLAAPVLAVPGILWGWRGNLIAAAVISFGLSTAFFHRGRGRKAPRRTERTSYLATYKELARIPGALPLLGIAMLRTAAFMGYLAYLAAFYDEKFAVAPGWFALVWSLSGASFFLGNLFAGRYIALDRQWLGPERMLRLGVLAALLSVVAFYFSPTLPITLVLTALMGASHATVAACVTTLLVRRSGDLRGSALSVNAAGMSLGVFLGAALGGLGLALADYPGTAAVFAAVTFAALVLTFRVRGGNDRTAPRPR